jgi:hypothetical protein
MDLDWICRLQINKLAADDAGLAIWSYDPRLPQVFDVIERWGFTFKSVLFTWVKITQAGAPATGTGYTTRKSTEQLLYATRGRGLKVVDHSVNQTILAPRREHSRKGLGAAVRPRAPLGTLRPYPSPRMECLGPRGAATAKGDERRCLMTHRSPSPSAQPKKRQPSVTNSAATGGSSS